MTDGKVPYSYTTLRYVHDVATGEFVNVGVLLVLPAARAVMVRTRKTIGRLRDVFPDLSRVAFTEAMRSIDRAAKAVENDLSRSPLFDGVPDAATVARSVLPTDDSSLQWSPVGAGLTRDADETLDRLFHRLVGQYDSHAGRRVTDDEVWRPVREKLQALHLDVLLHEKTIVGTADRIEFKHAWKNGQWHVYEPISLDMADAEGIREKARRWLGHIAAVADSGEHFLPHFLVGAPRDASLVAAYRSGLAILRRSPIPTEIFEEDQIDDLVAQIEDEVRASPHASSS